MTLLKWTVVLTSLLALNTFTSNGQSNADTKSHISSDKIFIISYPATWKENSAEEANAEFCINAPGAGLFNICLVKVEINRPAEGYENADIHQLADAELKMLKAQPENQMNLQVLESSFKNWNDHEWWLVHGKVAKGKKVYFTDSYKTIHNHKVYIFTYFSNEKNYLKNKDAAEKIITSVQFLIKNESAENRNNATVKDISVKKEIIANTIPAAQTIQDATEQNTNSDVKNEATKFSCDITHKPYKYAGINADKSGYSIRLLKAPPKPGVPVGIIDFKAKTIYTGMKTTHSKKSPVGDLGEMEWLTYLDKKPVTNNSYVFFIALLDYKGQKYQSVFGNQITDKGTIDKIHNSIIKSKAVTDFLAKNKHDGDSTYSLASMMPTVFSLNIQGLNAVIACYKDDVPFSATYGQMPYVATVIVINGRAFPIAGNCSNISDVYKLGNNYFIRSLWEPCNGGDESLSAIYEIRANGIIKEADM